MTGLMIDDGDGTGAPVNIQGPLGRAADAASVPVALSTEDVAFLDGIEGGLASILAKIIAAPATEAKQDTQITALAAANTSLDAIEASVAGATPAGSAIIGKVGIDQTTPGTTNLVALAANQSVNAAQINGVTVLMGNGPTGTGSQRVTIADNNSPVPVSGPITQTEFIAALKSATNTHSSVNSGASSVTILASNANRKGARIFNTDANALFLDLTGGTAVAATRAQVSIATNIGFDVPAGYTGLITGIWAADGSGVASVCETTV